MPKNIETSSPYLPSFYIVDSIGNELQKESNNSNFKRSELPINELNSLDYLNSFSLFTTQENDVEEMNETILSNAVIHSYSKVGFGPLSDQLQNYLG